MRRYRVKFVKDENNQVISAGIPRPIEGDSLLQPGEEIIMGNINSNYPKYDLATDQIIEDIAKKDRETDFEPACVKAKTDALTTTWDNLTTQQKMIIQNMDLSDSDKDQIITDFPEA